ncbi:hypothetical protein [Desulfobacca acetoxidans]|uniref:Uncharacterized protein n=1 Tax=Desulfobacca acetoxidans (strain ATCC 700848 / DSM 11109 / ASRB2) TaxID=880072 RepID=F2NCR7_DESAR|nr:hypothetical protein [Desulfobacca acetoxidans]AEB09348.1 hypothetical protein Desac_1493 [Desulfobacca acetoxidans DSM 11109]HAY23185.1 hypothetical protein [Desulfobacterales bacterium]
MLNQFLNKWIELDGRMKSLVSEIGLANHQFNVRVKDINELLNRLAEDFTLAFSSLENQTMDLERELGGLRDAASESLLAQADITGGQLTDIFNLRIF